MVHCVYLNVARRPYVRNAGRGQCPWPGLSRECRHNEDSWVSRCRYQLEIWRLTTGTGCERGLEQHSSVF